MHNTDSFHDSHLRLVASCAELISMGNADPVAYDMFVRIHLNPWVSEIQQVAEALAESEVVARAASRSGCEPLEHLLASGEGRLFQALASGDARLAAQAAIFVCGVRLAIEAC